ncbi:MAG TPA: NAD-dependent epimerase/dehydratase family protein [Verrucomicrobiae bacterium]|nr:NAD-dependent epimerase/dehydratase family protein [Verrucomicrobiae bacterium]
MKVLVTGGAGFIGSHVTEALLAREYEVVVLDDFNDFYDPALKRRNVAGFAKRAEIIEGDIRAKLPARKFDAIIHLAARAGVRPSLAQPRLYTDVNVAGTQNLLEFARETGAGKFIFASSSSVYGVNQKVPFSESDLIQNPISPYAATKLAGEALCHVYHHLYGIDMVCLRFFTVYGPRQRPDLAIRKFTEAILGRKPIEVFGDGSTRRDYTYIDDILQGVLAALDRPLGYEIINLGESRTVELRELIALIEKATGKSAKIKRQPPQPGDVPTTFADISKARRLLDYNPQVAIEDGIARFVEWYQATCNS